MLENRIKTFGDGVNMMGGKGQSSFAKPGKYVMQYSDEHRGRLFLHNFNKKYSAA